MWWRSSSSRAPTPTTSSRTTRPCLTQPPEPGRQAATGVETGNKGGYKKVQRTKEAGAAFPDLDYPDILEGSGIVLEGLEEKGLDAKTYIQVNEAQEC